MYRIKLSDGTIIDNLGMNGNNFVSATELTPEIFEGYLSPVIITNLDTDYEEVHEHMELVQIVNTYYTEGNWYFILRDLTEEELRWAKVMGDIDYLAMMSDVEL